MTGFHDVFKQPHVDIFFQLVNKHGSTSKTSGLHTKKILCNSFTIQLQWKPSHFWSLQLSELLKFPSGWWFGCHQFYFPRNIGLLIIPIDSYFSEGFKPPTSHETLETHPFCSSTCSMVPGGRLRLRRLRRRCCVPATCWPSSTMRAFWTNPSAETPDRVKSAKFSGHLMMMMMMMMMMMEINIEVIHIIMYVYKYKCIYIYMYIYIYICWVMFFLSYKVFFTHFSGYSWMVSGS